MGDQNEQGRRRGTAQAPPAYWALPDRGHHREVDVLVLEPTEFDVLLGRGKLVQRHAGNLHFQELIAANQETYMEAACRQEKISVAQQVVVAVYDRQGRFLKFEEHLEGWVEVSDKTSRSKVCQAFKYRRQQDEQHPAALLESAAGHPARPRRGQRHR